jgi:hypothetical protein
MGSPFESLRDRAAALFGNFRFQQAAETRVCNTGHKPPAVAAGPQLDGIDTNPENVDSTFVRSIYLAEGGTV